MHCSPPLARPSFDDWPTVVHLLQSRALQQPDQTAYRFLKDGELETSSFTYRELNLKAQAYGAHLRALGLAGQRVLLLFPSGAEFISAFFGCLYAGAIAVPAYPPRNARSLPRIRGIVEDASPAAVLTTAADITRIQSLLPEGSTTSRLRYVATDTISTESAADWEDPRVDENALAFLQYTSGSTASPKGVMVTHRNIFSNLEMIRKAFCLSPDDVGVGWLPLFHDMGLIGHVLEPIYAGIPSILMSPAAVLQKPMRWLRAISKYRATVSGGPNFAYDLCLRKTSHEERSVLDLSNWRVAFTGAEPVRASTIDGFSDAFETCGFRRDAFLPCYGLAEATLMVCGGPADRPPLIIAVDKYGLDRNRVERTFASSPSARRVVGCGAAAADHRQGQRVVIANPETLTRCGPNEVGEIWVAGPHIAKGYWQRADETRATFHGYLADTGEGPFLRTGDLGHFRDGNLLVTGRLKDLIILNGRNICPQDIEWSAERSHSALPPCSSAAFSVDIAGQEQLVVVQELAPRRSLDPCELLSTMRQVVAEEHEVPVYEVVLIKPGTIPKTSSGKIQRNATRIQYLADELQVVSSWRIGSEAPQGTSDLVVSQKERNLKSAPPSLPGAPCKSTISGWLIGQIALELRVSPDEIDIHQPFTHYGLASIEGVALAGKLEEWLAHPVPLSLLWDYPTIDAVSSYLIQFRDRARICDPQ